MYVIANYFDHWYRDLLVLMERSAVLDQEALGATVAPRDTRVYVDPLAIRESKELEDHWDQLVLKEIRYILVYIRIVL